MAVRIVTMTSPDNVSGNSVSIKRFKVKELELMSWALIVWSLYCSSHGLDSYSTTLLVPAYVTDSLALSWLCILARPKLSF